MVILVILVIVAIIITVFSMNPCTVQHLVLTNEIKDYENTLDSESCEILLEKIDLFNDQCIPEIEILDCG